MWSKGRSFGDVWTGEVLYAVFQSADSTEKELGRNARIVRTQRRIQRPYFHQPRQCLDVAHHFAIPVHPRPTPFSLYLLKPARLVIGIVLVEGLELGTGGMESKVHLRSNVCARLGQVTERKRGVENMLVSLLGRRPGCCVRGSDCMEDGKEGGGVFYSHGLAVAAYEHMFCSDSETTHRLSRRMGGAGHEVLSSTLTSGFAADVERMGHAKRGRRVPSMGREQRLGPLESGERL